MGAGFRQTRQEVKKFRLIEKARIDIDMQVVFYQCGEIVLVLFFGFSASPAQMPEILSRWWWQPPRQGQELGRLGHPSVVPSILGSVQGLPRRRQKRRPFLVKKFAASRREIQAMKFDI